MGHEVPITITANYSQIYYCQPSKYHYLLMDITILIEIVQCVSCREVIVRYYTKHHIPVVRTEIKIATTVAEFQSSSYISPLLTTATRSHQSGQQCLTVSL